MPRLTRTVVAAVSAGVLCLLGLSACDLARNTLVDGLTSPDTVTAVQLVGGGGGDISISVDAKSAEVNVKRTVHYGGSAPGQTAHIDGMTLVLGTDCGHDCSVSYQVVLPAAATVSGSTDSGDLTFSDLSGVDITGSSGNVTVNRVDGPVKLRIDSGDAGLTDVSGPVNVHTTSGNIEARNIAAANLQLVATSGDIDLDLAVVADVQATATSGDITVALPAGPVNVKTDATSGDVHVNVPTDPTALRTVDLHATSGDITVSAR